MEVFAIRRQIGIDAGHRVPLHGSKCRSPHGHRYEVFAVVAGPLHDGGEQDGMTMDFGFVKDEMLAEIDAYCDHAFIYQASDPYLNLVLHVTSLARETCARTGWAATRDVYEGKVYLVPFAPTAENLAKHWFERLAPKIRTRSEAQSGKAWLAQIEVYETPNCVARFPAKPCYDQPHISHYLRLEPSTVTG